MTKYISNEAHYKEVIERVKSVKRTLWIGTADIKDLYVKGFGKAVPFLKILNDLVHRGVEIRLLYAKEPGQNFKNDFDKYPLLIQRLEFAKCPRVHFKIFVFDMETVYIGSANLTGAGMGMKSENKRNFEAGILTSDPQLAQAAIDQFDQVWMGSFCQSCQRKEFCEIPIG